jgi:hypothetical protein
MFEELYSKIIDLTGIDYNQNFKDIKKEISKMEYKKASKLFTNINIPSFQIGENIIQLQRSVFSYNYEDNKIEHIIDSNDEDNSIMINLESYGDKSTLIFNLPVEEELKNFLQLTESNKIFIPVFYDCIGKSSVGHMAIMMIDKITKSVYYIEPNYRPSYFNRYAKKDLSYKIEDFLKNYFNLLGYNYKMIDNWNIGFKILNKTYNGYVIGSGHCVALSILYAYLITKTNKPPDQINNLLGLLTTDELIFLVTQFTYGIYGKLN